MAYNRKNNEDKIISDITESDKVEKVVISEKEKVNDSDNIIEEKKKFSPDELIACVSITPGELFYVGSKTKNLYTFADIDDVVEIEFKDLDYAARSKDPMMFKPRFVVQDRDFVKMHSSLDDVYSGLHSVNDLKGILKLHPKQMEQAINALPYGAKDAIKTIAMTMIDNGSLDSIQRVKLLDSLFGTEMLTKLTAM